MVVLRATQKVLQLLAEWRDSADTSDRALGGLLRVEPIVMELGETPR